MVSAGSADQAVHIWDEPSTQELYFLPGHTGSVNEVRWGEAVDCVILVRRGPVGARFASCLLLVGFLFSTDLVLPI